MAETIEKLDPNFRSQTLQGGFVYQDLYQLKEVRVSGLFEGTFCRMDPEALSGIPSEGLQQLAWNTAGATVRFRVPGGRFAVRMELRFGGDLPHMPRTGLGGLDVYCKAGLDRTFHACFRPERRRFCSIFLFMTEFPGWSLGSPKGSSLLRPRPAVWSGRWSFTALPSPKGAAPADRATAILL